MKTAYQPKNTSNDLTRHRSSQRTDATIRKTTQEGGKDGHPRPRLVLVKSKVGVSPESQNHAVRSVNQLKGVFSATSFKDVLQSVGVAKVWLETPEHAMLALEPASPVGLRICVQFEDNNSLLEKMFLLRSELFENTKGLKEVAIAVHLSIDRRNDAPSDTLRIY